VVVDEVVDAGICTKMRAAFGMSGSPEYALSNPCPLRCRSRYD
jgi:hypothetical protein